MEKPEFIPLSAESDKELHEHLDVLHRIICEAFRIPAELLSKETKRAVYKKTIELVQTDPFIATAVTGEAIRHGLDGYLRKQGHDAPASANQNDAHDSGEPTKDDRAALGGSASNSGGDHGRTFGPDDPADPDYCGGYCAPC